MARPRNPVPKLRHHRPTGSAVCDFWDPATGKKRQVTLGPWNTEQAGANYRRLLADLAAAKPPAGAQQVLLREAAGGVTVAELAVRFLRHAGAYYRRADGSATNEVVNYRVAVAHLVALAAEVPAAEFGPADLKACRDRMVGRGNCRPYVNAQVARLVRVWRWAAEETPALAPAQAWAALKSVRPLQLLRTSAPEPEPVEPVPDQDVLATLPHLPPHVGAMVLWCRQTGCRPQDVCGLTPGQVDRAAPVWVVRPGQHKTAWRGHTREYFAGPSAQAVVLPYLEGCKPGEAVFSPRRLTGRGGGRYRGDSFGTAVARAAAAAGVPHWSPGRLRHTFATEARDRHGIEVASVLLGHKSLSTTEIYACKPRAAAMAAAAAG